MFNDYVDNHNIPQNSYAIIELRTMMSQFVASNYDAVHPECEELNKLTDTLKSKGCKIMLIMGTHEFRLADSSGESTRFLDNVDIHISLDLYYLLCYSFLCDIEENGLYNSTLFINNSFSESNFLRDWLLPYLIQHKYGEYSSKMGEYDDLVAKSILDGNNYFLSYLDNLVDFNISILPEQNVGTYNAFIPMGFGYVESMVSLNSDENLYDMFGNNKYFAIGGRYGYEYWLSEALMLSLREANDCDVFDIFSHTDGYDYGYEYNDDVIYCGASNGYIDAYLHPIIVDFLCDNDLEKYDRIDGRCNITDMPVTIGDGKLRFPSGPIAKLIHYLI